MSTRAEAIATALRRELVERKDHLNAATDLGEIIISVKLQPGTTWVRGVRWTEERVCRATHAKVGGP